LLEEQNTSADSRRLAIEGSVDSRGGIKESDPLRIADTKVDAVAAGGVVGGDEGEVEIDRVLGVVGTVEKAKQFRAAVAEVVVSVQLVPGKDAGRALGGGTEEEERRFVTPIASMTSSLIMMPSSKLSGCRPMANW
jgi:hypothetical protein